MKGLLIILVLLEFFFVLLAVTPIFVDRRDLARAVYSYSQDQTDENKKKLEAEQENMARMFLHARMVMAVLFGVNSWGLIKVCLVMRRNRKPALKS